MLLLENKNTSEVLNELQGVAAPLNSQNNNKKEETKMAENSYGWDSTLHTEHAAIRHDVGLAEANIRDKVGSAACALEKAIGDNRYTIATEAAALSKQIGSEACGINQEIGTARRETAQGFADTRYNVATNAGDIRREIANEHCKTNDIVRAEGQENVMAVKDAQFNLAARVGDNADRIVSHAEGGFDRLADRVTEGTRDLKDRFFDVGRDLADLKQGHATLSKDIELNALKTQIEGQKNTQYLSDKIYMDGEKTRALINDLKYHDLNRGLVERNAELVECESDRRHWRHRAEQNQFQGQWAQLQSQIQAFASQLQETRQGMVNFGTMAGVGQSSTSNNVR